MDYRCPNCESTMNEGETCPECDHDERTGDCECSYCLELLDEYDDDDYDDDYGHDLSGLGAD